MPDTDGSAWLFKEMWGFDSIPSGGDFDTFLKILLTCANGDGQLTQAERNWVVGYTTALGGPAELIEELKTYPATEHLKRLIDAHGRAKEFPRALVYDAIRASGADGRLSPFELAQVYELASCLGVPKDVVQQLEDIYAEEQAVRQKRLDLIWAEGKPY